MSSLFYRRVTHFIWFVIFAALIVIADTIYSLSLQRTSFYTGWMLILLVIVLAAYNFRKKVPFLPIGSSASWLQFHIYAGLLTSVLFLLHIRLKIPTGVFEILLALVYLTVFISGIFGLIISRVFARRLALRGHEVMFEQIPRVRNHLRAQVEHHVFNCLTHTDSTAVPELYAKNLKHHFEGPRNFWEHLIHLPKKQQNLLSTLNWEHRYMSDYEKTATLKISELVKAKDNLDYHYAHQAALKYWLFLHVPLSYTLILFALAHLIIVSAFTGGIW